MRARIHYRFEFKAIYISMSITKKGLDIVNCDNRLIFDFANLMKESIKLLRSIHYVIRKKIGSRGKINKTFF